MASSKKSKKAKPATKGKADAAKAKAAAAKQKAAEAARKKKEQEAAKKKAAALKERAAKEALRQKQAAAKQKEADAREKARREAEAKKTAERREKERQAVEKRIEAEKDKVRRQMEKQAETQRKALEKQMEAERKARLKEEETKKRAAEKEAERQKREAEKQAERERREAEKAAAAAARAAEKAAGKKRPIPMSSLAATPIFRPLGEEAPALAPPPPPSKPGHVDHQILSAVTYGLFAAVNKTFGFAGQSVVKNASLRMLEYGYKRGWLPPRAKEPVRALNEFFGRLEAMGYADKIHIAKRGDNYALEVVGLADFDAVHSLREMHYPLLPVFLGAMLEAIVDQYFQLKATLEPIEWQEQKRGFTYPFSLHERSAPAPEVPKLPATNRLDEFED